MMNLFETKQVNVFSNSLQGKAAEFTVNGRSDVAVITIVQPYAITVSGVGGVRSYSMDQVESGQVKLVFLEKPSAVVEVEEKEPQIIINPEYKSQFGERRDEMKVSEHITLVWLFKKKKEMHISEIAEKMKKWYPHWGETNKNITSYLVTAIEHGTPIAKKNQKKDGIYIYTGGTN
ncbi:hypothetical protein Sam46_gp54 [Bacillus phage vB_BcM_Sam46]|uniref:Uncharacterized protein n=2 Tax=Caudoviricetes TaxID=2731619 RepID=A0A6G9L6R3_9CAUD|nr:hypothetical protein Sam112_gp51 [Bacillus phage vB_BcM_Sam112]QIQ61255.1 hypothetical protein Sam46_gp54 [Bacillus phage vB_BcM_Sam46]